MQRAVTTETVGAWVIKCNPRSTPLAPMRAEGVAKPEWCVADNYRTRLIEPGQRVLFWVTGQHRRGLWGLGRVRDTPYFDSTGWHVRVHIPLFSEPVPAATLATVPGLRTMEVFRSPQQANPSFVSDAEFTLIEALLPPSSTR